MTFKIFDKTDELRDRHGDWDGDIGNETEIEMPDDQVEKALAEIIFNTYFGAHFPYSEHNHSTNTARMKKRIADFISDCDLKERLLECFADELNEWVKKEYAE